MSNRFILERQNISLIDPNTVGLLNDDKLNEMRQMHKDNLKFLRCPRRPAWLGGMSGEELEIMEYKEFIEWRKKLAELSEEKGIILTPFEKNLEFWRQFWRVLERSDLIVQIIDARNPLMFYCEDIHIYTKEISSNKENVVLFNKSDYLTDQQRKHWADYFDQKGITVLFFSALAETNDYKMQLKSIREGSKDEDQSSDELSDTSDESSDENQNVLIDKINEFKLNQHDEFVLDKIDEYIKAGRLFKRKHLIEVFKTLHTKPDKRYKTDYLSVGFLGYPNVGNDLNDPNDDPMHQKSLKTHFCYLKLIEFFFSNFSSGKSSTINALLECKKVSISATPGKTKHFQTIFLDKELCLVDCPGLVFPNFVLSKAEMILNGILPIDQIKDYRPPVNLLTSIVPLRVFRTKYSLVLPVDDEFQQKEFLTTDQLLNSYSLMKGYVTGRGLPDHAKSAKCLIKDFVTGHLLYCYSPPTVDQQKYQPYDDCEFKFLPKQITPQQKRVLTGGLSKDEFDERYFKQIESHVQTKSINGIQSHSNLSLDQSAGNKPWREMNKMKRNKREKLRKTYRYLDEH